MPRIWADTIDIHRRQVHDAILDATAALMAEHGPMSVGMSAIATRAGIGRATLYKYFPDVQAILVAWHARDFAGHLERLKALGENEQVTLDDVGAFVAAQRRAHPHRKGLDVVGNLAHTVAGAEGVLHDAVEHDVVAVLTALLARLARRRAVRRDHDPEVLARWLLHALHAPATLDDTAVAALVIDSLAPGPGRRSPRG